jgi:hypothetical protein
MSTAEDARLTGRCPAYVMQAVLVIPAAVIFALYIGFNDRSISNLVQADLFAGISAGLVAAWALVSLRVFEDHIVIVNIFWLYYIPGSNIDEIETQSGISFTLSSGKSVDVTAFSHSFAALKSGNVRSKEFAQKLESVLHINGTTHNATRESFSVHRRIRPATPMLMLLGCAVAIGISLPIHLYA